jgi:uncharacterized membrane protein HdeD (DUF308 family)
MKRNVAFWITIIRGLLAVSLGVALFFARGVAIIAGAIGIFAGIAMLSRSYATSLIAEEILLSLLGVIIVLTGILLGVIIVLTGILHAFGGFRVGEGEHRKMSVTGFLLGIFEIILGVILILEPLERGPVLNLAASIWALVGGFILISGALQQRKQKQVQEQRETQEEIS